ncbi:MAG: ABC transporter ATP-binding protein [Rhizomicrobium sp.]|jgi:iron complex transport system ATP-binding protein
MSAVLSFDRVSAGYRGRAVLNDVSIAIEPGKVTGLVGANGAGKTTLLRVALGLLETSQGDVRVLDRSLRNWPRDARARAMAYLPQGADAHWPIEARRLVALGRMPHRAPFAPLSPEDCEAVDRALARCDAAQFVSRRMDELSAGERARILLARALATEAPILIADEPAAHLDPVHQLRLMELLREEAAQGAAVIVTLHDLALASRFCDEIVVLQSGRVVSQGPANEALSDGVLAAAFGIAALKTSALAREQLPIIPWRRL